MSNSIVTVNVSETLAPAPDTLQQSGAMISQGGTTLAPQTTSLLTQLSDLTALLAPAITLDSLTSSGTTATGTLLSDTISSGTYNATTGLVTLTISTGIGVGPGNTVKVSSATGTGSFADIDGTYVAGAGTSGVTITYTIASGLTMTITGGDIEATLDATNGDTFWTTIAGSTTAGYNGLVLATVASATTFTYSVASGLTSPAVGTITFTQRNVAELQAMANSFFAQGGQLAVSVLELGPGEAAAGVTALTTYLTNNPNSQYTPGASGYFYAYLVPRSWASESTYLTLVAEYEATTSKTYFFTTVTTGNYTSFTKQMKSVFGLVEAPTVPGGEFSCAAPFFAWLNQNPTSTNQVAPFAFRFMYGMTMYPTSGTGPTRTLLKAAGVNIIGFAGEGGLTNTCLFWGTMMDTNGANYWYSIDWLQLNIDLDISNAVINGSNAPSNPLYYNQAGINRLQGVAAGTLSDAVTYGLAVGTVKQTALSATAFAAALNAGTYAGNLVINAEPFATYTAENPNDYGIGEYDGFTVAYVAQNGFIHIVFNVNVSNFTTT